MTKKTPRLDTARRREYHLRWMVVEKLKRARLSPVKGFLPLSLRSAAKALKVDPRYLQMAENGIRVPRYRRALRMLPWIKERLGLQPERTNA